MPSDKVSDFGGPGTKSRRGGNFLGFAIADLRLEDEQQRTNTELKRDSLKTLKTLNVDADRMSASELAR
jgi:hypothetical protein